MSEGTKREYGEKKVIVHREGDKGERLRLEPSEIDLQDWEWVEWTFEDLKEGEFGFISFKSPQPRLGPFYSLRSFDSTHFLGKGNKGLQLPPGNDYDYVALVLAPESPTALAQSPAAGEPGAGKIHNRALAKNTAPEIRVTYKEVKNDKNEVIDRILTVTPDPVGLNRGDTATWLFEGLPENAFACFKFTPTMPGMNTDLGPFLAFNACNGDHDVTVEASAMGFAAAYPDPKKNPQFTYHIELRDWDGNLLASHDPLIDNLGPPPPGQTF